ncbi:hypothetical protein TWF730_006041 [Orbilia blumenaviensis]|uniref:Uncharacterized protein n=1 Tax=Orbilia blumenaviensis TaxID=1796055 RepID=A0AAV9VK46_9PEZI
MSIEGPDQPDESLSAMAIAGSGIVYGSSDKGSSTELQRGGVLKRDLPVPTASSSVHFLTTPKTLLASQPRATLRPVPTNSTSTSDLTSTIAPKSIRGDKRNSTSPGPTVKVVSNHKRAGGEEAQVPQTEYFMNKVSVKCAKPEDIVTRSVSFYRNRGARRPVDWVGVSNRVGAPGAMKLIREAISRCLDCTCELEKEHGQEGWGLSSRYGGGGDNTESCTTEIVENCEDLYDHFSYRFGAKIEASDLDCYCQEDWSTRMTPLQPGQRETLVLDRATGRTSTGMYFRGRILRIIEAVTLPPDNDDGIPPPPERQAPPPERQAPPPEGGGERGREEEEEEDLYAPPPSRPNPGRRRQGFRHLLGGIREDAAEDEQFLIPNQQAPAEPVILAGPRQDQLDDLGGDARPGSRSGTARALDAIGLGFAGFAAANRFRRPGPIPPDKPFGSGSFNRGPRSKRGQEPDSATDADRRHLPDFQGPIDVDEGT